MKQRSKNILLVSTIGALIALVGLGTPSALAQSVQPSSQDTTTSSEDSVMLVDMEADRIEKRGAFDSTIYLIDNVKFHHNGAIIECDSAFRYDDHRMEFFGDVIINQDSAYVYGDRVLYDGRTSIAEVFAPLVKMMQGDVTLYSYNLKFDTRTNTGTYVGGGVLTDPDNYMESERGEFNANSNIVKFKDSVLMRSDSYQIRTDSLDYNLDREIATFLAHTTVWDRDSNILIADRGFYFNAQSRYDFVGNAYVLTPDQEMWGDTLSYYQPLRQVTMKSNVQLLDTIQRTIALSDWAFYDDSLSKAVLTRLPSVIMYDSLESDKVYFRADSIVMSSYDYGKAPRPYPQRETALIQPDSVMMDSLAMDSVMMDSTMMDSMVVDTIALDAVAVDTVAVDTTSQQRVVDGFHNVKLWAQSYQMVSDSIVAYISDSTTSLFGRPILWNEGNQISADRIDTYMANDLIDWVDFIGSPFMTQSVEPKWHEPEDSSRFNQVSGRQIQAFFRDGEIDSTLVKGNVMNYYYYLDDVGFTSAFAKVECPELVVFFKRREPAKMSWRGSATFDIYPIEMIPADVPQRMENFQWNPDLRPKSAKEITTRKVRETSRPRVEAVKMPSYPIETRIGKYKEKLLEDEKWRDRTDQVSVTPEYFLQNNRYEL